MLVSNWEKSNGSTSPAPPPLPPLPPESFFAEAPLLPLSFFLARGELREKGRMVGWACVLALEDWRSCGWWVVVVIEAERRKASREDWQYE